MIRTWDRCVFSKHEVAEILGVSKKNRQDQERYSYGKWLCSINQSLNCTYSSMFTLIYPEERVYIKEIVFSMITSKIRISVFGLLAIFSIIVNINFLIFNFLFRSSILNIWTAASHFLLATISSRPNVQTAQLVNF